MLEIFMASCHNSCQNKIYIFLPNYLPDLPVIFTEASSWSKKC